MLCAPGHTNIASNMVLLCPSRWWSAIRPPVPLSGSTPVGKIIPLLGAITQVVAPSALSAARTAVRTPISKPSAMIIATRRVSMLGLIAGKSVCDKPGALWPWFWRPSFGMSPPTILATLWARARSMSYF